VKPITWWWIFWKCLIGARNPAGAKHWAIAKLIADGWIRGEQTCPRRMSEPGPWEYRGGADWWRTNQWGSRWRRHLTYWLHNGPLAKRARLISDWGWTVARRRDFDRLGMLARWIAERFNWYQGGDRWEWAWQPRTCSFCGGAHPDDILKLMREGWEIEGTDKGYKRYVEPPRSGERTLFTGAGCRGHKVAVRPWHAVPPVKLYVQHFSEEQVKRFNIILAARYAKAA